MYIHKQSWTPPLLLRPEDAEPIHSVVGPEVLSRERIATLLRDGLVSEEAAGVDDGVTPPRHRVYRGKTISNRLGKC
jgi:hypothetical protein